MSFSPKDLNALRKRGITPVVQGWTPAATDRKSPEPVVRKVLGQFRSKWEADYEAHLVLRRAAGEVVEWHYEKITFKLADDTRFTPDFNVLLTDGSWEFVEVKGYRREDAMIKFKVAAEQWARIGAFVMVQKRDGAWVEVKRYEGTKLV